MKKVLLAIAILSLSLIGEAQTDKFIASGSASPYLTLGRGLVWGGTGNGTVGQNFIFHPLDPNQGFCVFVFNNNTTSSHTFSITVGQTGDPALQSYSGVINKWTGIPTTTVMPTSVPANSLIGINYKTTASAGIVISISGNVTQVGSPDTADMFTVQTDQSSCGSLPTNAVQGPFNQGGTITTAQQFPVIIGGLTAPGLTSQVNGYAVGHNQGFPFDGGGISAIGSGFQPNPSGTFSTTFAYLGGGTSREAVLDTFPLCTFGQLGTIGGCVKDNLLAISSDQFSVPANAVQGFTVSGKIANPVANATILHSFNAASSTVNPAYKWLIVSCSTPCELLINRTSALGTTCTALTVHNLQLGNNGTVKTPAVADVAENACATQPTATYTIFDIALAANATQTFDLEGFVNRANAGGGAGIDVVNNTLIAAGFVTATLEFVEQ